MSPQHRPEIYKVRPNTVLKLLAQTIKKKDIYQKHIGRASNYCVSKTAARYVFVRW